jgi:hypothetical protein
MSSEASAENEKNDKNEATTGSWPFFEKKCG